MPGGLFDACKSFLPTAGKIASSVLGKIPWGGEGDGKSDIQVLCNLTSTLLSELKDTNLGKYFVLLNCVLYTTGEWRLTKILPSYRSPTAIKINNMFLLDSQNKDIILSNLQVGFLAE